MLRNHSSFQAEGSTSMLAHLSAANQSRNLAMGQHFHSLAAKNDGGNALPTVRGHKDQVATIVLRSIDDRLMGMIMHDVHTLIWYAGSLGSIFRYGEVALSSCIAVFLVLLWGVSDHHRVKCEGMEGL